MHYCETMFEYMVEHQPNELLELIQSGTLEPADLTFAAEIAGKIKGDQTIEVLKSLLAHKSPVVREGAIYGLGLHLNDEVKNLLSKISETDLSEGVRFAAKNTLEDLFG